MNRRLHIGLTLLFLACFSGVQAQFYTGSNQTFGKNRVQFGPKLIWQNYVFPLFEIHFYKGGDELAEFTAKAAEGHIASLEQQFELFLEENLQFIIYNTQTDFRQSNIGLSGDDQFNIGGVTRIVGTKVFLYFEGDHGKFEEQIRAGIAEVLLNQLMYGVTFSEVAKNSALLNLPAWYTRGFISYATEEWNYDIDNWVRDGILNDDFDNFNHMESPLDVRAGHALWSYIAEIYGEAVIPNILYMTKISRNVDNGFLYVLGIPLKELLVDFRAHFKRKYEKEQMGKRSSFDELASLRVKNKKKAHYTYFKVSPNGQQAAYVENILGQYRIYLLDLSTGKRKRIYKKEHKLNRIIDYTFPVINWHPSGQILTFFSEFKGQVMLYQYDLGEKKISKRELKDEIQKVLDFSYSKDGRKIVFSGVKDGRSDLYLYQFLGNAQFKLTDDIYDDRYPSFRSNDQVLFSSNRFDDTLRLKQKVQANADDYDIFSLNNINSSRKSLTQLTFSDHINETKPLVAGNKKFYYLADQNGITNRFLGWRDSVISHIDTVIHYNYYTETAALTDFDRNILDFHINPGGKQYSLLAYRNGKYHFFKGSLNDDKTFPSDSLNPTSYLHYQQILKSKLAALAIEDSLSNQLITEEIPEDTEGHDREEVSFEDYTFEDEQEEGPSYEKEVVFIDESDSKKKKKKEKEEGEDGEEEKEAVAEFKLPQKNNYHFNFAIDYLTTQLDNSFLVGSYQKFTGSNSLYRNPGFNGLMKMGISDLFENHRLVGGFRLATNLKDNEYLLMYYNMEKRLDKQYVFYKFSTTGRDNFGFPVRAHTHEGRYILKWPFSEVLALRGTLGYRFDNTVYLSSFGDFFLLIPDTKRHVGSTKLELIFDNTLPKGLNLFNGTRLKIFGEYYKTINQAETDFFVTGLDIRHYQKIHRNMIWAGRLAGSSSFGREKLLYFMGGVDNWMLPKRDETIQIDPTQNYQYQTLATPVRGFWQNTRNGHNFALINNEIRWPIFSYLFNRPLRSSFWNNYQLIGFCDVGVAWTGWNPYSKDNSFNTTTIQSKPVTIFLNNQREPIIYGYGFGMRAKLLGYFVRLDWAWGVDDGVRLPRVIYLSLNLDF